MWGICVFFGVGDFPLFFQEELAYIDIVMIHSAPVLCGLYFPPQWSLTVTIHRVFDDVAATHTNSACVDIATSGRNVD